MQVDDLEFSTPDELIKLYAADKLPGTSVESVTVKLDDTEFKFTLTDYHREYGLGYERVGQLTKLVAGLITPELAKEQQSGTIELSYQLLCGDRIEGVVLTRMKYGKTRYMYLLNLDLNSGNYIIEPVELVFYNKEFHKPDSEAFNVVLLHRTILTSIEAAAIFSRTMAYRLLPSSVSNALIARFYVSAKDISELEGGEKID